MLEKSIKPPFKPSVKNERDLSNIDKAFLGERPVDSPVNSKLTLSMQEKAYFEKFTYVADDDEFLMNDQIEYQDGDSPVKKDNDESQKISLNRVSKDEPEKTPELELPDDE
jgi:Protein kinase C terminal domain